ncbi:hypothetical protein MNBD_CHLOROFLEXI01-4785 [hydrothermal vent metagenome]|uniref:Uncharacterized protein n=1 Tax=hydrothermal vent metagenome TaxID=652676 RepID=A0A3B0UHH9_9ZZZZ
MMTVIDKIHQRVLILKETFFGTCAINNKVANNS